MIPPDTDLVEFLGSIIAFVFTIIVLLYAFGDNPLFRLAIHIFIGAAAGYAGGVAWHAVIRPHLIQPLLNLGNSQTSLIDLSLRLLLIALMLTKVSPRIANLGNPAMAYLVGIGAATAIGGAIQGTIIPLTSGSVGVFQIEAIRNALSGVTPGGIVTVLELVLVDGTIILIGTIATLVYFNFSARSIPNQTPQRNRIIAAIAWLGELFIAITFGVLFAGVYIASLNALIERLFFLWNLLTTFLLGSG